MTAIPTKLYEAFEKIRLGKINEGVKLFDKVDGFDDVKAAALAELSYFRHDWKNGILFAQEIFSNDLILDTCPYPTPSIAELHLQLFILATCQLQCWKDSRKYLEQLKKSKEQELSKHYNIQNNIQNAIMLISDPQNTTQRLLESKPKLRITGKEDLLEKLENSLRLGHSKRYAWHSRCKRYHAPDSHVNNIYCHGKTEDHITFYEKYSDYFEDARTYAKAAKSYIAMHNIPEAKNALRQYMRYWKYKEPYQVMPIVLFADHELWSVMSDGHFTESLLTIPHNRES
ncbi:MAG: hypothetical protein LBT05_13505 [Planctomycetaceae bacterium]|nr:hypothetical protein [Planctomycetaceae bacterium]